ncbi:toll-like receptor 4 [Lineus longissimus]|uniref:toll-like receptor 4 n=1 Tax=Lineus longissimus TaxID=88925 RepID=UPI002B4F0422
MYGRGNNLLLFVIVTSFLAFQPRDGAPLADPAASHTALSLPKGCHFGNDEISVTCQSVHAYDIPRFINSLSSNTTNITISSCDNELALNNITFPDLLYLEISTCDIKNFTRDTVLHLTKLRELILKNNHIASLDGNIFENLFELEKIDLNNNDLVRLDKDIFQSLLKLVSLDISNNRLIEFAPALNSKKMRYLGLGGNNGITNATISTGSKTHVCDLDLSFTGISELHASAFANLVCEGGDLRPKMNISFRGNFLQKVDPNAFDGMKNVSLARLDMGDVRWDFSPGHSALTDFFQALSARRVDYLDLSGCYLSEENVNDFPLLNNTAFLGTLDVSKNIFGPTIKTWPIYVNKIASIDSMQCLNMSLNSIGKGLVFNQLMPNLRELDLSNNQIVIYKDSIKFSENGRVSVPFLRILHMTGAFGETGIKPNDWTNLTWFSELKTLEELYLDANYKLFDTFFYYHLSGIFGGLTNLRILSLSDTGFGRRQFRQAELENFLVDQRKSLISLKLRNNYISHRQLVILKGLENLETLDLRSNHIGYLDDNWFNLNLRELDLSDNSLLTISCTATLSLALESKLERMWIGDNPYDCTCQLADFVYWLKNHARGVEKTDSVISPKRKVVIPDLSIAECMGPRERNGQLISRYLPNRWLCDEVGLIVLGAVGSFFLVIFAIAAIVAYNCRVNILFCFRTSRHGRHAQAASRGVFMGYCDGHRGPNFEKNPEDQWVNDNINTNLELCRDLPIYVNFMMPININKTLGEQIREKHQDYRYILLIVGSLFIRHVWESVRVEVCEDREIWKQCRNKFVLVLLGKTKKDLPPEMKALWKHGACYTWPKPSRDQFWKRLKLKLADKRSVCCF